MNRTATMQAIRLHAFGEDPVREAGIARPAPGPGEVLVRVEAAALNPLDAHLVSGWAARFFPIAFPYILGSDAAGMIEAVGEAVTRWTVGDKVIVWASPLTGGAFADVVAVPAEACVALPASISFAEGLSAVQPPDEAAARERGVTASYFVVKPHAPRLQEVVSAVADDGVRVLLDAVVPFCAFDDAFARQRSGRARGKIVMIAQASPPSREP